MKHFSKLLFLILCISIVSCKKYEDGPAISLMSKKARIANIWKVDVYYLNGKDITTCRYSVVMLGGLRRWILALPNQCENMHMLPKEHPSGRHSAVDWSKPDLIQYPNFGKVVGNEVILQPGDFLYVPTYWHHYIVSLNVNFQCNTRSGRTSGFDKYIAKCGF